MAQKPSIPKGTRDFGPQEMTRREYIFGRIREVFRLYGYAPIETPAMEKLSTLLGKYGEEGDKLLFRILNSGDFLAKVPDQLLHSGNTSEISTAIAEKGLRYDLTVPFARFVVQHQNEITFPFKRYQIQPVWRADRPQKGRYREFYQCDVDVIGSNSLTNEAELVKIIDEVFGRLDIQVTIRLNNRKILAGLAEKFADTGLFIPMTVAIDKWHKAGSEAVAEELIRAGLTGENATRLVELLEAGGTNEEKTGRLTQLFQGNETGLKGIEETETVLKLAARMGIKNRLMLDMTLARGLNYYTGAIFEVTSDEVSIGSICGGGRYDDLTGIFGLPGVSGVGISFGADRIYDVLEQLNRFPQQTGRTTRVLFVNFGPAEADYILPLLNQLRQSGIAAELYPDAAKMKKQLSYANNKNIPWVVLAGEEEIKSGAITLKNMISGEQKRIDDPESLHNYIN
ncbi:MAG: histidine--tRNA ligase [Bacteroidales bacterium]